MRERGREEEEEGEERERERNEHLVCLHTQDEENGLRVWHRHAGGPFHSFKFDVSLPSTLPPIFAVAKELHLMHLWNPFVSRGLRMDYTPPVPGANPDEPFEGCKLRGYVEVKMPWPLRNMAIVAQIRMFDALKADDSVMVVIGTEDEAMRGTLGRGGGGQGGDVSSESVPTTPQECPRLWLRVLAQATPTSLEPGRSRFVVLAKVNDSPRRMCSLLPLELIFSCTSTVSQTPSLATSPAASFPLRVCLRVGP